MTNQQFDYQGFAQSIASQASDAIPPTIQPEYKEFLVNTIRDFAIKAGEALISEDNQLLDNNKIQNIVQFIAEWTYRKGLQLIHSEIKPDYWQFILQVVAGGIFEAGRRSMVAGGLDENTISTIIATDVENHFNQALNQLKEQGYLTDEMIYSVQEGKSKAAQDIIVDQDQQNTVAVNLDTKQAKLATVAVILSSLPKDKITGILENFSPEEVQIVKHFMDPENMNLQIDPNTTAKLLTSLKNTISPDEAPTQTAKNIKNLLSGKDPQQIALILNKERPVVQLYVKSCIEGKFIRRDFSNFLAKAIHDYLQKQLSTA